MSLGNISQYDDDCSLKEKKEEGLLRLDLGCGNNKKEGFKGVDISKDTQADYFIDLEIYPWIIFDDNSVYEIHCSHYIEHTSNIKDFMEEIYRILIPGGRATFYAPYYSSIRAMQDYTHKRFISEATFLYFNKKWMEENRLQHYGVSCDFAILSCKFLFQPEWNRRSDEAKEYARKHSINVVDDIEVVLSAIKEENNEEIK